MICEILLHNHNLNENYIIREKIMNIYKNDPKYKIFFMSKNHQFLYIFCRVELSKSARTTKTQNHTFCKFL